MRLRTTLFAILIVISIVLSGAVYAGFSLYKHDITEEERSSLAQSADSITVSIDRLIEKRKRTVRFGSSLPAVHGHGSGEQQATLERFVDRTAFDGATILDVNGTMRAASMPLRNSPGRGPLGENFSDRAYFRRSRNGSVYVSDLRSTEMADSVVTISAPIRENGTVVGTFNGAIDVRNDTLVRSFRLSGHGRQYSIQVDGRDIYSTGHHGDHSEMISEESTVNTTGWTVVVATPWSHIQNPLWVATVAQTGAVGLAILSVALMGVWVSRTTLRHIQTLLDGLSSLEAGNYDHSLDLGLTDEWQRISSKFNTLANTLDQRESQSRVLNRVLRHNLRNDMNVITAHTDVLLDDDLDPSVEPKVRKIRQSALNLIETSEHARTIYDDLLSRADREPKPVEITDVVTEVVELFRGDFPDATVRTDLPDEAWTVDSHAVPVIVEELCRNALIHNDHPDPEREVDIDVETDSDTTRLIVRDNGPGMPAFERELLTGERERSPTEHGSGLGLWVVNWLVDDLGGTVSTVTPEDRGTVVTVSLPVPDEIPAESSQEEAIVGASLDGDETN
ncbi:MAG: signal transduction histidine kinase [Haloarculaceae archaeon]|jgi:signal transduction histidine kinase